MEWDGYLMMMDADSTSVKQVAGDRKKGGKRNLESSPVTRSKSDLSQKSTISSRNKRSTTPDLRGKPKLKGGSKAAADSSQGICGPIPKALYTICPNPCAKEQKSSSPKDRKNRLKKKY